jgi:hypothetical protein|tara:strand:+ start:3732 stop:5381 length:1650 start_codon:yes stop_codon:yes gene_type:complete
MSKDDLTTYEKAFELLAEKLEKSNKYQIGSFWEFTRDIWAEGFEHPDYFRAWHVGVLCEEVEKCIEDKLNYLAILPRAHFKSTILGHAFSIWRSLKIQGNASILYLSYSDTMAKYHISEINKEVNRNPLLKDMMTNRAPKADFTFRYDTGNNGTAEILHGGLFSFKRGMHVNGALIADDILKDPESPLAMGQMSKIEDHFLTESLFIPNQNVPVVVVGTPMMPGDLLTVLEKDERFVSRKMPALDPEPDRRVLMPELYSEEWLLEQQRAKPKSFASEFLLQPHFNMEAYFDSEDIEKCEDANLRSFPTTVKQNFEEDEDVFAGFDVGKKRHPSHLVVFKRKGERVEQIHQSWLDGWDYSDQIIYLNEAAENFGITKGYIDNTRGELEDRGLNRVWYPLAFTLKSKNNMAHIFEEYIHSGNLFLIKDHRQRQQILSVNNELKAPETPMGHGDAFFSIAMALQAAYETGIFSMQTVGDLQDFVADTDPSLKYSNIDKNKPEKLIDFDKNVYNDSSKNLQAPNPSCTEDVCGPSLWVPARGLCLYCNYRRKL